MEQSSYGFFGLNIHFLVFSVGFESYGIVKLHCTLVEFPHIKFQPVKASCLHNLFAVTKLLRYTILIKSKNMCLNKNIHQCGRPMNAPTDNTQFFLHQNIFDKHKVSSNWRMISAPTKLFFYRILFISTNLLCKSIRIRSGM